MKKNPSGYLNNQAEVEEIIGNAVGAKDEEFASIGSAADKEELGVLEQLEKEGNLTPREVLRLQVLREQKPE